MMTQIERKKASKEDLYNKGIRFKKMYTKLSENRWLIHSTNNSIVKIFIDAKNKGNYRSIVYDVNCPELTLQKSLSILKRVEHDLDKPFECLTQLDIDNYQQRLNDNVVFIGDPKDPASKPLSYKYKTDIIATFRQFWTFYRLYNKYEKNTEVPNILEFLRVRKPKNSNRLILFLTKDELDILCKSVSSQQMKALYNVFFETGARVVEILKLKYSNCSFDESNKTWIIKLPNEKGKSTQKMPIELSFSSHEFDKWIKANNFSGDDYVFQYSYDYLRNKLSLVSKKNIGRHITPKEFRKGMAMYLVNHNVNDQYIRAHMGWSANSKAISHYINQTAIKRPDQPPVSEIESVFLPELNYIWVTVCV